MIYEHKTQPLLNRKKFLIRMLQHGGVSLSLLLVSLGLGMLGYHFLEGFTWIDSLLNASMILGGMGPVDTLLTPGGKIFASLYAIFSGTIFLIGAGILVTPMAHRLIHRLQLEEEQS